MSAHPPLPPSSRGITGCHGTRPTLAEEAPQPHQLPFQGRSVTSEAASFGRLPGPVARVAMSPAARPVCLFPHELLSQRGHPAWGMGGGGAPRRRRQRGPALGTCGPLGHEA